jgi:hypothetical protein
MANIQITYGNNPTAEGGYKNVRWQINNDDMFNPFVSAEVAYATTSVEGILKIGGDIDGTYTSQTVVALQGTPVNNTTPTAGQFLQLISGAWKGHTLVAADIPDLSATYQVISAKDVASGYAGLNSSGLLALSEIPNLPASQITSGQLALAQGGTGVDLSSAGGTHYVLKQDASHVISAGLLVAGDIPDISATYLTVTTAAATYLTITTASSTYAPLVSPALTGTPTAPTATGGTNTTQIATTAFVTTAIGAISTTLAGLSDVTISGIADGDFLEYDAGSGKWLNGSLEAADIPSLAASKITSGTLALARGGTNADLSATGGTSQVLQQSSSGAAITVGQLAFSDISGSATPSQLPDATATTKGILKLAGDINAAATGSTGTAASPMVTGLMGIPFANFSVGTPPGDGQVLTYINVDGALEFENLGSSGGGVPNAVSVAKTTSSLAANAAETGTWSLGTVAKAGLVYKVTVDHAARVTIYGTAAARDADSGRPNTIPPTPGTAHGVMYDLYLDGINAALTWLMSPPAVIFNQDSTQAKQVYYRITNIGTSSTTVTATMYFAPSES